MEFGEETGKDHTEMVPVREVALRRRCSPPWAAAWSPSCTPTLTSLPWPRVVGGLFTGKAALVKD